jgi:hypothetical protein
MSNVQTQQHPAKAFGAWLREKRLRCNMAARVFAGKIWLSHAKYAEVELGIVKWIAHQQEVLIALALFQNDIERKEFTAKLKEAKAAKSLDFSDIFSRDDLRPVRACHHHGKQITKDDEERILNAVFAPLI